MRDGEIEKIQITEQRGRESGGGVVLEEVVVVVVVVEMVLLPRQSLMYRAGGAT